MLRSDFLSSLDIPVSMITTPGNLFVIEENGSGKKVQFLKVIIIIKNIY
jgi:hypothetical protein